MNTQPRELTPDSLSPSSSATLATLRSSQPIIEQPDIQLPQMMSTAKATGETREAVATTLTLSAEEELAVLQKKYDALQKECDALQREFNIYKQFTRHIIHDMGTPLLCLFGYMAVALTALIKGDLPRASEYINRAMRSGDRLKEIIQNVLISSKYENGVKLKLTDGDMGITINNVVDEIRILARQKNIALTFVGKSERFSYDEKEMARVIYNLVGNAIKFCESGNGIEVSLSNTDGSVFISVSDTGEGIPSNEIDSLFQNYSQIHRSRKSGQGVGLGLSICRSIVEAHGGKIWVTNNDGVKGVSFNIRVPRTSITTH